MRFALATAALSGCTWLTEQRTDPTSVFWSGWVLVDLPDAGTVSVLDAGAVDVVDLDGEPIADGAQPYPDSLGWWEVEVPVDIDVAVRIQGSPEDSPSGLPEVATMVWRGHTPTGRGIWLEGALYTRELAWVEGFFSDLETLGAQAQSLSDGEIAHLWGEPLDPDAWAGADIEVVDANGESARVLTFTVDDAGALTEAGDGPVDLFVALNLPPGTTTLRVSALGRTPVETTWPTRGGDLLSAAWLALPESP